MNITLPDGSVKELKTGSTGLDLAMDIGPGLAKAAIAVTVNGDQKDLSDAINEVETKEKNKPIIDDILNNIGTFELDNCDFVNEFTFKDDDYVRHLLDNFGVDVTP